MKKEQGSILIFSLILLTVMTIIAFSILKSSRLEQKITNFEQDQLLAQMAADTALRYAKFDLEKQCFKPANCNAGTGCKIWRSTGTLQNYAARDATWWSENVGTLYPGTIVGVRSAPQIIVQEIAADISTIKPMYFQDYRIIVRAVGATASTVAFSEILHRKYTPFLYQLTNFNQGPGNLIHLGIYMSTTPPLWIIPDIMQDSDKFSTTTDSSRMHFMCVKNDGLISIRTAGSGLLNLPGASPRYFWGLGQNGSVSHAIATPTPVLNNPTGNRFAVEDKNYTTFPDPNPAPFPSSGPSEAYGYFKPVACNTWANPVCLLATGNGQYMGNHGPPVAGQKVNLTTRSDVPPGLNGTYFTFVFAGDI